MSDFDRTFYNNNGRSTRNPTTFLYTLVSHTQNYITGLSSKLKVALVGVGRKPVKYDAISR
jgi:hypothetical protein